MLKMDRRHHGWMNTAGMLSKHFVCGFCGLNISSDSGYGIRNTSSNKQMSGVGIYICHNCGGPTFFDVDESRIPAAPLGEPVKHVPEDLNTLYEEARRCTSSGCYTAAVLLCRKALMNIAVDKGADSDGKPFAYYVKYLADNHWVPPNGQHWVDHIRKKGNEATHEIALMEEDDARDLLHFVAALLRFIHEFPKMVPAPPETGGQTTA